MADEKSSPEQDAVKDVPDGIVSEENGAPETVKEQVTDWFKSVVSEDAVSLDTQVEELREALIRTQADLQNVRRRSERDVENAHKYAVEKFVRDLLGVLDSMDRALELAETTESFDPAMLEGTQMTHKLLLDTAAKHGVESLNPVGELFDPKEHQAMSLVESAEYEGNTVMAVMQKGYKLEGRVIRAAMVVVTKAVSK